MSAPTTSALALAKPRCIENLRPGQWWLGEYEDGRVWAEVRVVMDLTNLATGAKTVRVIGTCVDGQSAELHQLRGFAVPSLTAAQARKAGLTAAVEEDSAATAGEVVPTLRIAIDADCPRCGWPERFFDTERQVFGCTKRTDPCGYESSEREA